MRGFHDEGRRPGLLRFKVVGLAAIGALPWGLSARGQTTVTKPFTDPPPVQTPAVISPDYTLTTTAVTIQYKTKREKGAQAADLALVGVSPAEVVIKGSRNGVPLKDPIKAILTVTYKNRSGDYASDTVTPDGSGNCKASMKGVATALLDDIGGMMAPGFDPGGQPLSLEEPVTVSISIQPAAPSPQAPPAAPTPQAPPAAPTPQAPPAAPTPQAPPAAPSPQAPPAAPSPQAPPIVTPGDKVPVVNGKLTAKLVAAIGSAGK